MWNCFKNKGIRKNISVSTILIFLSIICVNASIPVISDIKVIGGVRGVGLSISADAPFDATFEKIGMNSLKVTINNCVYGLNTFSYTKFSTGVPLVKITSQELKASSTVQIIVSIENTIDQKIETHKKGTQWVALLTRENVKDFKWSAAEADSRASQVLKKPIVKSEPVAQPTVKNEPVVQSQVVPQKTLPKVQDVTQLVSVQYLQRNRVCALSFEFDDVAHCAVKRSGDTVYIQSNQAKNGLKSNRITVPAGTPYHVINIKEKISGEESILILAVTLDKGANRSGIISSAGNVVTLFSNSTGGDKLLQWTSDKGAVWDHSLYDLPSYTVDMKSIENRAFNDAQKNLGGNEEFFIKDDELSGKSSKDKAAELAEEKRLALAEAKAKKTADSLAVVQAKAEAKAKKTADSLAAVQAKAEAKAKKTADSLAAAQALAQAKAEAKAKKDAELLAKTQALAKAKEEAKARAEAEALAKAQAKADALAKKAAEKSKTVELLAAKKTESIIVIANNVNMRITPSAEAEIKSKLSLGNKVELIEVKGQWYHVKYNFLTGWIHQKYLSDSSKVTAEKWKEINGSQTVISGITERPAFNTDAATSGNTSSDDLLTGKTTDSVASTMQKKTIKYRVMGRDPFQPLLSDSAADDSENVNVERLKLVGVLFDTAEKIALLEDLKAGKKPYALRENDPVNHGKVLKIYKDKVVFLITEYGISRSYTIRLATKQEQEAGK